MADDSVKGTDFSPSVRQKARELAWYQCCLCRNRMGDDVHHIVPKEEGGQGVLENAILLCVLCHATYGPNKDKRSQIKGARDQWYEIVARRFPPESLKQLEKIDSLKSDVVGLRAEVTGMLDLLKTRIQRGSTTADEIASIGSSMVNSIAVNPIAGSTDFFGHAPTVTVAPFCRQCGKQERSGAAFCSACGTRLA